VASPGKRDDRLRLLTHAHGFWMRTDGDPGFLRAGVSWGTGGQRNVGWEAARADTAGPGPRTRDKKEVVCAVADPTPRLPWFASPRRSLSCQFPRLCVRRRWHVRAACGRGASSRCVTRATRITIFFLSVTTRHRIFISAEARFKRPSRATPTSTLEKQAGKRLEPCLGF
jgi:hypothetical protein